jgi:hypothetical protein
MSARIAIEAMWLVPRLPRNARAALASASPRALDSGRKVGLKDRVP